MTDPAGAGTDLKHSGLGVASFVLALVAAVGLIVLIIAASAISAGPNGLDPRSAGAITIGLLIFVCLFMALIGLGLGIAGIVQKRYRRLFAIIGTAINGLLILGVLALMMIGMAEVGSTV